MKITPEEETLFTFSNACGKYEVYMILRSVEEDGGALKVRCVESDITDDDEDYEEEYEDEEMAEYESESEDYHERALPYLQEICDLHAKGDKRYPDLIEALEQFGNPHYSPIPWPQKPLPSGAIE